MFSIVSSHQDHIRNSHVHISLSMREIMGLYRYYKPVKIWLCRICPDLFSPVSPLEISLYTEKLPISVINIL